MPEACPYVRSMRQNVHSMLQNVRGMRQSSHLVETVFIPIGDIINYIFSNIDTFAFITD